MKAIRRFVPGFRWEAVEVLDYAPAGARFRDVTRQRLFESSRGLRAELRYFEIGAGGHSALERHDHEHSVLVLRGRGRVLVGEEVGDLRPFDLVRVPSGAWHQFRADAAEPLGFLCLVGDPRDTPRQPEEADLVSLRRSREVAEFIRP